MFVLAALAVLPAYGLTWSGMFSENSQFSTYLYEPSPNEKFCSLTSGPGTTSNGIDYRVAFTFGDRNEIRFATERPLSTLKAILIEFDDGSEFSFFDIRHEKLTSGSVASVEMTRAMMTKLLTAINNGGGAGKLELGLSSVDFQLPRENRKATMVSVRECERTRLGQVVPD